MNTRIETSDLTGWCVRRRKYFRSQRAGHVSGTRRQGDRI